MVCLGVGKCECIVYWYFDAIELNPCAANNDTELPRPGGKIDYNLGTNKNKKRTCPSMSPFGH